LRKPRVPPERHHRGRAPPGAQEPRPAGHHGGFCAGAEGDQDGEGGEAGEGTRRRRRRRRREEGGQTV
ncbi:hypothetical protein E4U41_000313, partial [Claviceps citrina]